MSSNQGYVYVMINPSYGDGIVKIGKTTKSPEERAKELSSATGVATPFIVVYKRHFKDCHIAESLIHSYLTEKGYRVNNSREFFSIPIDEAINVILSFPDDDNVSNVEQDQEEINEEDLKHEYFKIGRDYELGENNKFINYEKAIEYYKKAVKLGHVRACLRIGDIYNYNLKNEKTAIDFYILAAERGEHLGYARLGVIYLSSEKYKNEKNQYLAWKNFIEGIMLIGNNNGCDESFYYEIICGLYELVYYYVLYEKDIPREWIAALNKYKTELVEFAGRKYDVEEKKYDDSFGLEKDYTYNENREAYYKRKYLDCLFNCYRYVRSL